MHDGEQRLIGPRGGVAAAPGPADAAKGRVAHHGRFVGQPHDVVEHHRHVAAQGLLNGHRPFRRDGHQPAVDVRAEDGLLLGHLDAMGEAEELEAAAIGQDGPVPAHEAVQAAERGNDLFAGPQGEMIGIAQHHLRPAPADLIDLQPFDGSLRGDGHEGGQIYRPVRRGKNTPPRRTVGIDVQQAERERRSSHGRKQIKDKAGVMPGCRPEATISPPHCQRAVFLLIERRWRRYNGCASKPEPNPSIDLLPGDYRS